ncbi:hypothetical protein PR048_002516 [Dryococelus australis]|uniref:Uncharacterized protein n=1 Tax=Dryococelus australis TaxID=614101 RepID=A0ABQ9IKD4_9NEOP|nr:hypothetical protein PR048_002516 [Dryococelus australis]
MDSLCKLHSSCCQTTCDKTLDLMAALYTITVCDVKIIWIGGAAVAERLARSPLIKAIRVESPAVSPDLRMWESCWTMPLVSGSSRVSPVSPAPSFRCCSILTSIALIGSEDLACEQQMYKCPVYFVAIGSTWRLHRKLLQPSFSQSVLEQFIPAFHDGSSRLVKRFQGKAGPLNVTSHMNEVILEILNDSILGVQADDTEHTKADENSPFRKPHYNGCVAHVLSAKVLVPHRISHPWLMVDWIYKKTEAYKHEDNHRKSLSEFAREVIRKRKAERESNDKANNNPRDVDEGETRRTWNSAGMQGRGEAGNPREKHADQRHRPARFPTCENPRVIQPGIKPGFQKTRFSLLDRMLDISYNNQTSMKKPSLTKCARLCLRSVSRFMRQGQESVATAMSFCVFLLAQHEDVQRKVHEEVQAVLGGSERVPTLHDLRHMRYLEQCVKEALRLYPSIPILGRKLSDDVHIGKYTLPADCGILICPYATHRIAEIFPDPEKFDPDRFLPENVQKMHPYAYTAFSAGPRNCIGK